MNTLLFKRNYKFLLVFFLFLLVSVVFWSTRIISYNFWTYTTEQNIEIINIGNSIDIFDDTIVHNVQLDISSQDYKNLILYYQQNSEKEYLQTNITIDGVLVQDVWVKLKGNRVVIGDITDINVAEIDFSFLVKFDKYIPGQRYQNLSEIALISGNISELQWEYIAGEIYNKYGVIASDMSFTVVETQWEISGAYLIKEVVNEDFLSKYYENDNGLLYKAENSLSFSYWWEDPTRYTDLFTQETLINNYDLKKLIEVLEFVSKSWRATFLDEFTKYIDIENYTKFLAINDILYWENDTVGLLNSYYIYYDLKTGTIQFIPWDQEYILSFEETSIYSVLEKVFSKQELVDLSKRDVREILDNFRETDYELLKWKYVNHLENKFLDESWFLSLFESVKGELESSLEDEQFIENILSKSETLLINY